MARDEIATSDKEMAVKPRKSGPTSSKERKEYMAQPRVQEYNKAMTAKCFNGRPFAFDNLDKLNGEVSDYLELCYKTTTVPTVMGLTTWLGCARSTIYEHANNSNSPFSNTFKNFINLCHTSLENGTIDGKINPVTYIFMGKNYFGLSDSKDIKVTADTTAGTPNAQETADALRKQLEEETVPNATIVEND